MSRIFYLLGGVAIFVLGGVVYVVRRMAAYEPAPPPPTPEPVPEPPPQPALLELLLLNKDVPVSIYTNSAIDSEDVASLLLRAVRFKGSAANGTGSIAEFNPAENSDDYVVLTIYFEDGADLINLTSKLPLRSRLSKLPRTGQALALTPISNISELKGFSS